LLRTYVHLTRKEEGEYGKILHGIMSGAFKTSFSLFYVAFSSLMFTELRVGTYIRLILSSVTR
jgi:hypothetical protein